MVQQRIKGQETVVTILSDGEFQARIDSIASAEITFELEVLEEGYLGETSNRYDSIFNGMSLSLSGHLTNRQFIQLSQAIVNRAQRRTGAAARIDVGLTLAFPGGDLVTLAIPDVQFGPIPFNDSSRSDYVEFTLEGSSSEFEII